MHRGQHCASHQERPAAEEQGDLVEDLDREAGKVTHPLTCMVSVIGVEARTERQRW